LIWKAVTAKKYEVLLSHSYPDKNGPNITEFVFIYAMWSL